MGMVVNNGTLKFTKIFGMQQNKKYERKKNDSIKTPFAGNGVVMSYS
jgi:hypothetical protein